MGLLDDRLIACARRIARAGNFPDLVEIVREEVQATLGYQRAWLMVTEDEAATAVRLIEFSGPARERDRAWDLAPRLVVRGDAMLEEILFGDDPVLVEDARTDPRPDKKMVAHFDNRTILNIGLRLLDQKIGALGTGTFGDAEGVRPPSREHLEHFVAVSNHVALAANRIRFGELKAQTEREQRLLERRMLHSQRLESLGVLAGGIAHDFNNLLTVILSSATLVSRALPDGPLKDEADAVLQAAESASALARQLLAMGRNQSLRLQPLDLDARLAQLVPLLRRVLPDSIDIDLVPGRGLPEINADPSQVDQVFMNLCLNARDAMPEGGRLTITTSAIDIDQDYARQHAWARPGRYVMATVTDTGVGMSAATVERIFEPFFTTKEAGTGSGLGLAVAYGIVTQHRGMVVCESEPGRGTALRVYLPERGLV